MKRFHLLFLILLCALIFSFSACEQECKHTNMRESKTEADCTQSGATTFICNDCGYTYKENIIEPKGHSFNKTTTEPECTKDGYTVYTCECGYTYTADIVSATGHEYKDTITSPTCTSAGYITHTCQRCDYTYVSNQMHPTEHSYTKVEHAPTCTAQGYSVYTCNNCGDEYISDYKSHTAHILVSSITAPTCESGGYTIYSCINCQYTYKTDHTEPLGHNMSSSVVSPNCENEGYTSYSCKRCNYTYNSDFTEPLGHTLSSSILSPTCTDAGESVYSCENCDYSYTEQIAPTGHMFSSVVTMPTLSDMGYTEYTCKNTNCGYSYTGNLRFYSDILPNGAYADNSTPIAQGIDVSEYNYGAYESIDFASIRSAGIDYVIIKAGSSYRDNFTKGGKEAKFEQSYADAKAAGLDVGVYFYTYAKSVNEIIQDARLLISILDGKQFEYPIYLDLEDESLADLDKATITEMCVEFFTILQRAGYYTGLYINDTWLKEHIDTETALQYFEIWYSRPKDEWDIEKFGENLGMWQYSFEGTFESMGSIPFDLSISYKNYPEIIKNGGFNGYSKEEIKFIDSGKEFVYVIASSINVRSTPDFDSTTNKFDNAYKGDCFEVIERTDEYTKIIFKGSYAYITANTEYVSFDFPN